MPEENKGMVLRLVEAINRGFVRWHQADGSAPRANGGDTAGGSDQ